MNPGDLRIGNLLATEQNMIIEVKAIGEKTIRSQIGTHYLKDLRGIHLSEKRIMRFGFRERSPGIWHLKGFHYFDLTRASYGAESFQAVKFITSTTHYVLKMHLTYVHQLQNLYWAHRDEELRVID